MTFQEQFYSHDVDYTTGSPHLSHAALRGRLVALVRDSVVRLDTGGRPPRVLEVGAGHGGYTETVLALGCEVTAVEMSRPSLEVLTQRWGANPQLRTVYDPDGDLVGVDGRFDLVLAASVLHHIPDYSAFLSRVIRRLGPGGALLTFQDPLWYPRLPRSHHALDRGAYLAWRVGRGNWRTGLASLGRRLSGRLDEQRAGDMVEYHVVRDGVDEERVRDLLAPDFRDVEIVRYWANQSSTGQRIGDRLGLNNTFAVAAHGYSG